MSNQMIVTGTQANELTERLPSPLAAMGQVANGYAQSAVFADYISRKADATIRTHAAGLATFAEFLQTAGDGAITVDGDELQHDPDAWHGVTWGIVEAFSKWLLRQGYAVATVNQRLSIVKTYAKLASKAGVIPTDEQQRIRTVTGYGDKEAGRINERRDTTRLGDKKAEHVSLTADDAETLKAQDLTTAQGRRDALLFCLLLDHGLRVSEVAGLEARHFDLEHGVLRFYRQKVSKWQNHKLTDDIAAAAAAYLKHDAPAVGALLLGSVKGGRLTDKPMSKRAITKRVRYLGEKLLGKDKLSAHDCRHFWVTYWSQRLDKLPRGILQLQEAGGWSSMAMPRRYAEEAKIANEGMQ